MRLVLEVLLLSHKKRYVVEIVRNSLFKDVSSSLHYGISLLCGVYILVL